MSRRVPSQELVERVTRGDVAAIARLISRAESDSTEAREALVAIYHRAGAAHVIGVTGVPGGGKSTLVSELAARLRQRGSRVGIVAVDPSSPFSGGAILGDRIRMSAIAGDPGVYIRSMAARGHFGGIARATCDAVDILDVGGFDTVIIETVGVGQGEVAIAKASHTTVVVSPPGLGDEVQAIKSGILEIADIHVVSKFDKADAGRTLNDLKQMLALPAGGWAERDPQVVAVSCMNGLGLDELVGLIDAHRAVTFNAAAGHQRRLAMADFRLRVTAETLLLARLAEAARRFGAPLAECLERRDSNPYLLAGRLLEHCL
jgi:LAO/AO transport system kinase